MTSLYEYDSPTRMWLDDRSLRKQDLALGFFNVRSTQNLDDFDGMARCPARPPY